MSTTSIYYDSKRCSYCIHRKCKPETKHKHEINKCQISGHYITDVENYSCEHFIPLPMVCLTSLQDEKVSKSDAEENKNGNNKYEDLEIEFYKENPIENIEMICNADSGADPICVWDIGQPEDCFFANRDIKKTDCPHWVKKTIINDYTAKDVFNWLKNREK